MPSVHYSHPNIAEQGFTAVTPTEWSCHRGAIPGRQHIRRNWQTLTTQLYCVNADKLGSAECAATKQWISSWRVVHILPQHIIRGIEVVHVALIYRASSTAPPPPPPPPPPPHLYHISMGSPIISGRGDQDRVRGCHFDSQWGGGGGGT